MMFLLFDSIKMRFEERIGFDFPRILKREFRMRCVIFLSDFQKKTGKCEILGTTNLDAY